jgi:signal transduction histidine kinase
MSRKPNELKQKEFRAHAAPICDINGQASGIAGCRDLTEMIELQEKLEAELLEVRKAILEKDIFLASINHAVRTPLNCIVGYSELALDGDISQKTREYLGKIVENAERLLRIINGISNISKMVTFGVADAADETLESVSRLTAAVASG